MDPGSLFCELFEEGRSGGCTAPAASGVLQVRNRGTHRIEVLIAEGQSPHLLTGFVDRGLEAVVKIIVACEYSGIGVSQGNNDGAGEGRGVDQMCATELTCIAETVGQY